LGRDDRQAIGIPLAFALPVFLVVVFRRVPLGWAFDSGNRRIVVLCVPARDGPLRFLVLRFAQREDRAAILRSDVVALAVQLRRIMGAEKDVEDFRIGNDRGIVGNPDRLCVTGRSAADLLVRWVRHGAADVAAFDLAYANNVAEHRFGAPEASARNDGRFLRHALLSFAARDGGSQRACHPSGPGYPAETFLGRVTMRLMLAAALASAVPFFGALPVTAMAQQANSAMTEVLAHPRRQADSARDQQRHPAETLAFFRVQPG